MMADKDVVHGRFYKPCYGPVEPGDYEAEYDRRDHPWRIRFYEAPDLVPDRDIDTRA